MKIILLMVFCTALPMNPSEHPFNLALKESEKEFENLVASLSRPSTRNDGGVLQHPRLATVDDYYAELATNRNHQGFVSNHTPNLLKAYATLELVKPNALDPTNYALKTPPDLLRPYTVEKFHLKSPLPKGIPLGPPPRTLYNPHTAEFEVHELDKAIVEAFSDLS
jgi:hypothetical protein